VSRDTTSVESNSKSQYAGSNLTRCTTYSTTTHHSEAPLHTSGLHLTPMHAHTRYCVWIPSGHSKHRHEARLPSMSQLRTLLIAWQLMHCV
jgi:hypothetical protein